MNSSLSAKLAVMCWSAHMFANMPRALALARFSGLRAEYHLSHDALPVEIRRKFTRQKLEGLPSMSPRNGVDLRGEDLVPDFRLDDLGWPPLAEVEAHHDQRRRQGVVSMLLDPFSQLVDVGLRQRAGPHGVWRLLECRNRH